MAQVQRSGSISLDVEGQLIQLDSQEVELRLHAKAGWAAAQGRQCVVVLATQLTPELIAEGLARDVVRLIQDFRKTQELQRDARIQLHIDCPRGDLLQALDNHRAYICGETLAVDWLVGSVPADVPSEQHEVGGQQIQIGIRVRAK
jgi:isoleucyl-tRNA synthetase